MKETHKTLKEYIAAYGRTIAVGFVLVAVTVAVNLGTPFIVRYAVDGLNDGVLTVPQLLGYGAGAYVSISLVGGLFSFWMRRVPLSLCRRIEYEIRRDLFEHLTRQDRSFYQRERTGDIMTKMSSDMGHVADFIGQGLLQGTRTFLVFVIAFSIMFSICWQLALLLLILMPLMTVFFFFVVRLLRSRHELAQEQFSALSNFVQENFSGIRTIKSFAIESRQIDRFGALNDEFIKRNLSLSRVERPLWPVMAFLFSIAIVVLLIVGGRLVIRELLTLGELVQFMHYLYYMQWPMLALGWTTTLLQRGLASWERILEIYDREPAIVDNDETDDSIHEVRGDIEFRHVTVVIDEQTKLEDFHLHVPEGSTLGITGPTGGGKTLMASLLVRLLDPTEGQIFIGSHDVKKIPLDVLRRQIGVAPQEPFLFSETLQHNIGFGLDKSDIEKVSWAADVAYLTQDIGEFPDRFKTMLGERGVTLSGGQRQRTAISRAVARAPNILILDDVLSAVDTQTEAEILSRLRPVMNERTSMIISHRASTLRHTDFIVVIENGRMTQCGCHEELVREKGYYKEMVLTQRLQEELEAS